MTGAGVVLLTTFLASVVEAIEMVTIVVGVGATRGYRHTLMGAAAGLVVLVVVVAVAGIALAAIPIGPLRLVIGSLLLLFGLQWYRKGIVRVAARGFAGYHGHLMRRPHFSLSRASPWKGSRSRSSSSRWAPAQASSGHRSLAARRHSCWSEPSDSR